MEKRFLKGLFKDTGHIDQPEGTWRYALNATINSQKGAISNERGVVEAGELDYNRKVIGSIEISDGRVVLFVKRDGQDGQTEYSEIGVWENDSYSVLFVPNIFTFPKLDLAFNISNPIEGTFKIDSKGDLVVYFTDDLNPPRAFNVTRQERWLNSTDEDLMEYPGSGGAGQSITAFLYGLSPQIDSGEGDPPIVKTSQIYLLNLFPHSGPVPTIKSKKILEGGNLRTAVYYLSLALVDEDLVATNYVTVSNPVSIVEEFYHIKPTYRRDGAKAGNQTSKSILWEIDNVSLSDYKYIRPTIIRRMGEATDVFKLNDVTTEDASTHGIAFTGTEGISSGSIEEIMIDTTSYDTAKTINQLDGILYVGNVTGTKDVGYQKYANNIRVTSDVKTISPFDTVILSVDALESGWGTKDVDSMGVPAVVQEIDPTLSYRDPELNSKYKGYMRDEVYALYIAFILKDGSMSYGYHIPGREHIQNELYSLNAADVESPYGDLQDLGSNSALYHVKDFSGEVGANNMNYWQNTSEVYPSTEDYEVWDESGMIGSLHGRNVRHNHFPSNDRHARRSIDASLSYTEESEGTESTFIELDGTWSWKYTIDSDGLPELNGENGWEDGYKFNTTHVVTNEGNDEVQGMWDGTTFTANQPMDVTVSYNVMLKRYGNLNQAEPTQMRLKVNMQGVEYISNSTNSNCIGDGTWYGESLNCNQDWPTTLHSNGDHNNIAQTDVTHVYPKDGYGPWFDNDPGTDATPLSLTVGDTITLEARVPNDASADVWHMPDGDDAEISYFQIEIDSSAFDGTYYDASIAHKVTALGFNLKDVKIPSSLRELIQGFRIYYAKREHANKTILGQSVLLPMQVYTDVIGICSESNASPEATQIMGTLQSTPENFWSKDSWPKDAAEYTDGYKTFSFHDFHLLRTKNSLAPATHIRPIYKVNNYAWNGATIDQDKKMVTRLLNLSSDTETVQVKEFWGWDAEFNCYPKGILSAIFVGEKYTSLNDSTFTEIPRLIGQKAKTYLLGDTIFSGQSLGFGGKVLNEFGDSCIIFALKDDHELPALTFIAENAADSNLSFGVAHNDASFALVNPNEETRAVSYIANLVAFKTDVYKSIDSQELVFTGYEFVGDELDVFTFNDATSQPPDINSPYSTNTKYPEGIYGGDTTISRYGFVSAVTPSNGSEKSNPKRAIHYHIVESQDNINFRHSEDNDSLYFPGAAAKEILRYAGVKDYNHFDNVRYNENYSETNNIRPAFPLPLRDTLQTSFPTRAHRSAKADTTSLIDNYRIFLANQYKDLPKNRGDLWKLSSFNNLLYFHMENSLYATKGKQTMEMKDGTEAFIGSGDIFQQDPDEILQTELGYGGTRSQWSAITTRYGYFFVDQKSGKVFLMGESLQEVSAAGMEYWFKANLKSQIGELLEQYSLPYADNPILGMGLHSVWDPKNRRILLTFRDLKPTGRFLQLLNGGSISASTELGIFQYEVITEPDDPSFDPSISYVDISYTDTTYFEKVGWTISFYPESKLWGSFHSYVPYTYFNSSTTFYSLTDTNGFLANITIWEHNKGDYGYFYPTYELEEAEDHGSWEFVLYPNIYPFIMESVHNDLKNISSIVSSIGYVAEVSKNSVVLLEQGFTSAIIYNSMQMSQEINLEYLVNIRNIGNSWKINKFRDMSKLVDSVDEYYLSENLNVIGELTESVETTGESETMFTVLGMMEDQNLGYLDIEKEWYKQRKFTDRWVGIRLICDNSRNNLVNLYTTFAERRKSYR